jgi:molybdate transport system ATP-binding protein
VAIGRALLAQPRLLLMDEPLASLDGPRKAEILPYLLRLKAHLSLPILYVTHAIEEMQAIADTVVLLHAGRTLAVGAIEALTARSDLPLARRDDAGAVLAATLVAHIPDRGLSRVDAGGMELLVPQVDAQPGARLRLRIPAREIILATEAPRGISLHNIVAGRVRTITPGTTPHLAMVEVVCAGAVLLASITRDAVARLALIPGSPVLALIKAVAVEVRVA